MECNVCHSDHGTIVCDCGCKHEDHTFAGWCHNHGPKHKHDCEEYSQKLLNTQLGFDKRKRNATLEAL